MLTWRDTGSQWHVPGPCTAAENHFSPAVQMVLHPSHQIFIQSISHRSGCKLGRIVLSKCMLAAGSHILVPLWAGNGFQEDFLHLLPRDWRETDGTFVPWIFCLEDECNVCLSLVIRKLPWSPQPFEGDGELPCNGTDQLLQYPCLHPWVWSHELEYPCGWSARQLDPPLSWAPTHWHRLCEDAWVPWRPEETRTY